MKETDLVIIKPGRVKCLRCLQYFDSPDRCGIRTCPGCEKLNVHESGTRIISTAHWGAAISAAADSPQT